MDIKKDLDPYIFREYDIRGVVPSEINDDIAYIIGKSYGSYIQTLGKTKCIVGHDNRLSSDSLSINLIKGILETGIQITNIGLVTTPMYYYACQKLAIPSGIMITASHNPKDENGFKISFDERGNARGEMIQDFYNYTIKGQFTKGEGSVENYNIKDDTLEIYEYRDSK